MRESPFRDDRRAVERVENLAGKLAMGAAIFVGVMVLAAFALVVTVTLLVTGGSGNRGVEARYLELRSPFVGA